MATTHRYATRSKGNLTNVESSPIIKAKSARSPITSSSLDSIHSITQEQPPSIREISSSGVFTKLGTFLAAGGIITGLYSFGKEAAYNATLHGAYWLGWNKFNQATGLDTESEHPNFLKSYISTYTKLREDAQAGYFEGYCNIALSITAILGTAFMAHLLYKKCTQ